MDFLPREVVSYSKETQTPLATHQSEGKGRLLSSLHAATAETVGGETSFMLTSHPKGLPSM